MKSLSVLGAVVVSLCLGVAASGQTVDVPKILQEVTSHPRQTWIPAGTIEATHVEHGDPKSVSSTDVQQKINKERQDYQNNPNKIERTSELQNEKLNAIGFNVRYKLLNKWDMASTVKVIYDGDRFYWQIDLDARQDSILPDASLAGNEMTDQFNPEWNRQRIFVWDGQEYTTYSGALNQATIDAADTLPHRVTGPLTAGLIPWGYGRFSSEDLAAALAAGQIAARQNADGSIDMEITHTDGTSSSLTLDPTKAYAVTSATFKNGGAKVTYTCEDYRQVAGNWVPYEIQIERHGNSVESRLPNLEQWTFTSVSAATPSPDSFCAPLAANSVVEYSSPVSAASALYVESDRVDTRRLLAQRLAFAAAEGAQPQNCATAALQEILAQFGKSISDGDLARLPGSDGRTSLYEVKRLAQSRGLYCRGVQTNLAGLRSLGDGVQAILHLPGQNHFVVLQGIDERNVWLIDLSSRKFFYRQSLDSFPTDWPAGTALLLSDRPIPNQTTELSDSALAGFSGGAYYACNTIIQRSYIINCQGPLTGCDSCYTQYFCRLGCGEATSGSCSYQPLVRFIESPCDALPGYDCQPTGEWYSYYMRACQ